MGVDDVEVGGAFGDRFQRKGAGGARVCALATESQRPRPHRMELSLRSGKSPLANSVTSWPSSTSSSTSQATTRSVPP